MVNDDLRQKVGLEIKLLRKKNGSSLRSFAKKLGISHSTLSKIESGLQSIDIEMIAKIADYFNVSVDYLLKRKIISEPTEIEGGKEIRQVLEVILQGYPTAIEETFNTHPLAEFIRHDATKCLRIHAKIPVFQYKVIGSAGQGKWAEVPWIGIFDQDITLSPSRGYFLVYLFSSDMSGVYLSLNQGWTYFFRKYGVTQGRKKLLSVSKYLRENIKHEFIREFDLKELNLLGRGQLSKGFEAGHICGKYYSVTELPNNDVLVDDLYKMLSVYSHIKFQTGQQTIEDLSESILRKLDRKFIYRSNDELMENNTSAAIDLMISEQEIDYNVNSRSIKIKQSNSFKLKEVENLGMEKNLSIKSHYRSGKDNIGIDFFKPCLSYCKTYKRAVGYFSSSALITWASSLPRFTIEEGLSIQLLVSPNLTNRDKEALERVSDPGDRDSLLQQIGDKIILDALSFADGDQSIEIRMRLFSWMVASGKLQLRFAYPHHVEDAGIFHEKIGVFIFPESDHKIAFTGSANESEMGHKKNYESVDVFRSWVPADIERVVTKEEEFEEAWEGTAIGLSVKKLSSKVLDKVISYSSEWDPDSKNKSEPKETDLKWRHQDEAIEAFLVKEQGVLDMATGTGKTKTSLRICNKLIASEEIETIIISTAGNDLLDQWYSNVIQVGKTLLNNKFSILRNYKNFREKEYFILNPSWNVLIVSRQELPNALSCVNTPSIGKKTLLIHDEVHGLGSPANRENLSGLSENIRYRLGLSATPEREYDDEGNDFILEHIGPTIFQFGLEEAIERGILCPFNYIPIDYEITEKDRERLQKIRGKYEILKNTSTPMTQKELSMSISEIYKNSEAKIPLFEEFISKNQELLKRCIIFVGTMEYGQKILDIVHKYNPNFHSYFSGERSETLKRFASGELECMITCHRLSEGIDIKSLNNVIIFASDRSKLELIQRIGRSLRSDPNNPEKIANIVDFTRVSEGKNADDERKEWLTSLSKIRPKG
jgi:superfamily II DNA or RNA helicase/transcriptional regulator with XRE-family HTH domain